MLSFILNMYKDILITRLDGEKEIVDSNGEKEIVDSTFSSYRVSLYFESICLRDNAKRRTDL